MMWPFTRAAHEALVVEPLRSDQFRAAADIHRQTFSRPWTDGEIEDLMNNRANWALTARALDKPARVAGFVMLRTAADEAEVLTIAVKPSWQGYGVGRMLMDASLAKAYQARLLSVFLEVDERNKCALGLYGKLGFRPVAERPDYYRAPDGRRTKAIVMRRDLERRT